MPRTTGLNQAGDGVQAVVLALRILELLAFGAKPGRVTALADELGTSKNRIHRHLKTLTDLEYVTRDPDTKRYSPGIRLVQLGNAVADQYDLLSVSRPVMRRLRDSLGHTVVLSRVISSQLYAIERIDSVSNLAFGIVIGSPLGLHSSAQGKVVLAFGPAALLEIVAGGRLERQTPATIVDPGRLRAEVAEVQLRGYAIAPGETMTGLNAVAVPILDAAGELFGTLAILASVDEIPDHPPAGHVAELKAAAGEISAAITGAGLSGQAPGDRAWGRHVDA